jgi:hypothetical protein
MAGIMQTYTECAMEKEKQSPSSRLRKIINVLEVSLQLSGNHLKIVVM